MCLQPLTVLVNLKDPNCGSIPNLDLSWLGSIVNLSKLDLSGHSGLDLSSVSPCLGLTQLSLAGCSALTDLRPLSALSDLVTLNIDHTNVSDLTPLAPCILLKKLDCDFERCFFRASLDNIFLLHTFKSPAIKANVNRQLNYLTGVEECDTNPMINFGSIRYQLRDLLVTRSRGPTLSSPYPNPVEPT
jgi:Leucine-rich repeat (LRR) protein